MSAQRITGAWLAVFTVCVVVNHVLQSDLSFYDIAYGVFAVPLAVSSFLESRVLKGFQVAVILSAGVLMVVSPDIGTRAVGMVIMAFAQMYAYTYGFLSVHPFRKLAMFGMAYLALFVLTLQNFATGVMWVFMSFTIHGGIWVCARELVEKARRLDELEKQHLKQTLVASETLLRETVDAGMVLVQEIKSKESKDGCEG